MPITVGLLGPTTGFGTAFTAKTTYTGTDIVIVVGGVSVKVQRETLNIQRVFSGHDTATADVVSIDASFQPTLDSDVTMYLDGVLEFAGLLQKHTKRGVGDIGWDKLDYGLECVAYSALAERRLYTGTLAAGTLKSQVTTLGAYLTAYGVIVDPSMPDGPTMPASEFENITIWSALLSLMSVTAGIGTPWFPRMTYTKVLSMIEVGSETAPFTVTLAGREAIHDVTVETTREYHANKITGVFGPQGLVYVTDTFTGDGVTATFTLEHVPVVTQGYVTSGPNNEPLRFAGDTGGTWEVVPATRQLTRLTGAPTAGHAIELNYGAQMPFTVTTEDLADQAAHGIIERVYEEQGIISRETAENYVAAKLAAGISPSVTVTYPTLEDVVETGQTQTITLADRQVDDDYLMTEIRLYTQANVVKREIKAIAGMQFHGTFRQLFKNWPSSGGGKSSFSGGTTVGPNTYTDYGGGSSGTGPAPFWVQYWTSAGFGSSVGFQWLAQSAANLAAFATAPSAPSVADTGAGAYAATLRYYKAQFAVLSGTTVSAISNFGTAVSFTPSGSGTHARVTRPSSPGVDATHWRPLGSADGVTYVALSAWIAVGTTTFDDNVAPGSYAHVGDDIMPESGAYDTLAQLLLTSLSDAPSHSLQVLRSESGFMSTMVWDSDYPGETAWGAVWENGRYICKSEMVAITNSVSQSGAAPGLGGWSIDIYPNQTIGAPLDTSTQRAFGCQPEGDFLLPECNLGAAWPGRRLLLARNTNGSGAAGTVGMETGDGVFNFIWPDNSDILRIATSGPEADGSPAHDSGTVVGTQTSMKAVKDLIGRASGDVLSLFRRTPVYRFRYKNGAYGGTEFVGITTDDSPEFGMDGGRSFNPVSAFGHTVLAIQELDRRLTPWYVRAWRWLRGAA